MNATLRQVLDTTPVPTDAAGSPASCCAVREGGEWRTAWLIGTGKHLFGPAYPTARTAAEASRYLNEQAQL